MSRYFRGTSLRVLSWIFLKVYIFIIFFFTYKCSSEQSESHLDEVLNKEMESVSKEIKGIKIRKEGIKLLLFMNNIVVYIENPKRSTKKDIRTNSLARS